MAAEAVVRRTFPGSSDTKTSERASDRFDRSIEHASEFPDQDSAVWCSRNQALLAVAESEASSVFIQG